MNTNPPEPATRLSVSPLWKMQHAFFKNQGIHAWAGKVPFYVTSNPCVGASYAQTALRFIQDCLKQETTTIDDPFYIVETGAGHGKFSFSFLKTFCKLREILGLSDVPVIYVISDIAASNISFLENKEELQPYLERGILDFALFDCCNDKTIHLQRQKITVRSETAKRPMVFIANYVFDSVPADIFRVKRGTLEEGLVSIDEDASDNPSESLKTYFKPVTLPYYQNPVFDELLKWFSEQVNGKAFLFPTGPLQAMQTIEKLSNGRFMMIGFDKGYLYPWQLPGVKTIKLFNHGGGSSLSVNFSVLGEYCTRREGMYFTLHSGIGMKLAHYIMGYDKAMLPETTFQIEQLSNSMNPRDFHSLHSFLSENTSKLSPQQILSYLRISHWDPYVFSKYFDSFCETIKDAHEVIKQSFLDILPKIAANIYTMPGIRSQAFEIGVACQLLQRHELAIGYYERSLKELNKTFSVCCNLGLCHTVLGNYELAQTYFERAEEERPATDYLVKWLSKLQESTDAEVLPADIEASCEAPVIRSSDVS